MAFNVILGLGFTIPGLFLLIVLIYFITSVRARKKWPVTEGKMIGSALDVKWGEVKYEYYVNGNRYVHDQAYRIDGHNRKFSSLLFGNYYKMGSIPEQGTKIPVYYNPKNPSQAILELGFPRSVRWILKWVYPSLIIVFLTAGIVFFNIHIGV